MIFKELLSADADTELELIENVKYYKIADSGSLKWKIKSGLPADVVKNMFAYDWKMADRNGNSFVADNRYSKMKCDEMIFISFDYELDD